MTLLLAETLSITSAAHKAVGDVFQRSADSANATTMFLIGVHAPYCLACTIPPTLLPK